MDLDLELRLLMEMIETFEAMGSSEAAAAYWASTVLPQLGKIAAETGLGRKVAQELAYRALGFVATNLASDAEIAMLSGMLARRQMSIFMQRAMARAAAAGIGPQDAMPLIALTLIGISLVGTAREVAAASNDIQTYKQYMARYLGYVLRHAQLKVNRSLPPPATFDQWVRRDRSGAWWQF
ncbi:hypothetical protein [Vineibacter terrae]|uniref:hypothetical protein n=1 Tax=Vineibacter terrae TaxID=2586908 RepID=UPI002E3306B9|nr:hypothetical protein [Vineibacter terrae]HEX2888907.1 hypothetical protein [Vineibacter terrae]